MSDSEELPELFITSAINTRKRKICPICASTYEVYCLRCEQNVEFNKTVAIDRKKATSINSNKESSSSPGSVSQSTESCPGSRSTESVISPNRLREKRLHFLQNFFFFVCLIGINSMQG